jgi:hypothetical protein
MEKKPPPPLELHTPTYLNKQTISKQLTNAMYFHTILDHNIALKDYQHSQETRGHVQTRYEYQLAGMRQELADLEFVMAEVMALQSHPDAVPDAKQAEDSTRAELFLTAPQSTGCQECDAIKVQIAEARKDLRDQQATIQNLQGAYSAHSATHNRRSTDLSTENETRNLTVDSTTGKTEK